MFSIEEFIIAVFCCVDDWLKDWIAVHPIRSKGFAPALSDSEVITMEIVAEYQGIDADSAIWQYFRRHWLTWFPSLRLCGKPRTYGSTKPCFSIVWQTS